MSLPIEPAIGSLWEEFNEVDIVDVIVEVEAPDLEPLFSYRIPDSLRSTLTPGLCVHVPFAGRDLLGYVLRRRKIPISDPLVPKLKDVISIVQGSAALNKEQLHLVEWMSDTTVCSLLDSVRCVAPALLSSRVITLVRLRDPDIRGVDVVNSIPQAHLIETLRALDGEAEIEEFRERANIGNFQNAYSVLLKRGLVIETRDVSRPRTVYRTTRGYVLGAVASLLGSRKPSANQERVLTALNEWQSVHSDPIPADALRELAGVSQAVLKTLQDKGVLVASEIKVRRAPVHGSLHKTEAPILSEGQDRAAKTLRHCIESGEYAPTLLFGVTASGKTEVYLSAIANTLAMGRTAIVLVPEIALTAQVVDVFMSRFGERVAVLHSRLSDGERHDEWRRMQSGEAKIVVGARSAIFAPLNDVGLIVVDEEHEASYKQEKTPRYNAKALATERARISAATLVLGSATPSIESYYHSVLPEGSPKSVVRQFLKMRSESVFEEPLLRIEMRERIDNRPLPAVHVIDQRADFKQRRALFSAPLADAIQDRLTQNQQTILFLNRRGYAQFILCRDCGYVAKCPNCAVSLSFHLADRALHCHHCEHIGRPPAKCPDCGEPRVKAFGLGTEKVEEEVLRTFPSARVARLDRDTTSTKGAHSRIIREFRSGEADILIGTQMVAKGLDFPNVTLVGVISADTAINMPDFRAAERTFQLLTQVAGRSGRGTLLGEVFIQTFSPEHYAVQAAIQHDYEDFYRQEILFRKELKYPPFSRFANLICTDTDELRAEQKADALAEALQRVCPPEVEIIGPAPAPIARLKNNYRFHVAIRAAVDAPIANLIRSARQLLLPVDRASLTIDIDPLSMA